MKRFRTDNTEGYSASDLDCLNGAFEAIMAKSAAVDGGDLAEKSWQDHIAETLLARYDAGERGPSLDG